MTTVEERIDAIREMHAVVTAYTRGEQNFSGLIRRSGVSGSRVMFIAKICNMEVFKEASFKPHFFAEPKGRGGARPGYVARGRINLPKGNW